jgi:hypothetical protein
MAARTHNLNMRSGQRETCFIVIKCCRLPHDRAVACDAIMVKTAGDMVWVGNIVEIGLMAAKTVSAQSFELAILVAARTLNALMRTRQRKSCIRMIERRRRPYNDSVTRRTIMREQPLNMIRILNSVIVALMTRIAISW